MFGRARAWATTLWSNHAFGSAAKGAYRGVSDAWSAGVRGTGMKGLLLGDRSRKFYGAGVGGAAVGAAGGAWAGGEDHRVSGAVTGGLLGAGAGLGGRVAYNNRRGIGQLARGARRGASRGWQRLDQAIEDLRYSRDYEL